MGEVGTDQVSVPFVWEGVEYRLVDYHFTLWLPVEPEDLASTEQLLRSTYRDQRVSVEEDDRLRVDFQRQLYGIYNPTYGTWKILEKKPEFKKLLHEVLPAAVLRRWPF